MDYAFTKYLAGYIDGDGSISLMCRKHNDVYYLSVDLRFCVDASAKPVLEKIVAIYGGTISPFREKYLQYYCNEKTSVRIIEQVKNHLVLKGPQAEYVLKFYREKTKMQYTKEEKKSIMKELTNLRNAASPEKPQASIPWLAGYIDSDGCFYKNTIQFNSHMRCTPAMSLIQKALGGSIGIYNSKVKYTVYVTKKIKFLQDIVKYLIIKRHNVERLLYEAKLSPATTN